MVLLIAPSPDFLIPPEKLPGAIKQALEHPKSKSLSAVAFAGGSQTWLCDHIEKVIVNPTATYPLHSDIENFLAEL